MKTSDAGRALIVAREGRRLVAYRDTRGIATIGVGHTGRMSPPPVTPGMRISEAECDAMLASDLAPVEKVLNETVRVPMTQNEFDAMASLGFNIGVGGLKRSSVIAKLNCGDVAGAAQAFMHWSRPAVLVGRRKAESRQFLARDAPDAAPVTRARADLLATRAKQAKAEANPAKVTAGVVTATGAAAVTVAAQAHHGHLAWAIGGIAAVAVAVNAVLAWHRHRAAARLAANAAQQADAAASLIPSSSLTA